MKRILTILTLITAMFIMSGCAGNRGFKVTSCSIASISPSGLKGVKAVLDVGIINPLMSLTISKVEGMILNEGKEFATFESGKVSVPRRSEGVYPLPCTGTISKGIGLTDLLKLAVTQDFSGMTINMAVKVKLKCGLRKTVRFKDIKISDLMEPEVAAAYLDIIINETMI